jgi:drug/metabolite transporter (DMT)-like permease
LKKGILNWLIFIALSVIWGSSFVLMKEGLKQLTSYQVAAIRILSSGIILLPFALRAFRQIPINKVFIIFLSGLLGSLLPAFLFCIAESEDGIDSALAGTLNSLTPIFVIITGAIFFRSKTALIKIIGIIISFTGSVLLLLSKGHLAESRNLYNISFIVLATVLYGINVNMVHQKLSKIGSLNIAAVAFTLNAIPAAVVLIASGYFQLSFSNGNGVMASSFYSCMLGVFGTALATVIFYMLVKRAGAVFSSMVTYGIPIVANIWGIIYGEDVGWIQFGCLALILAGVYIANRTIITQKAGEVD